MAYGYGYPYYQQNYQQYQPQRNTGIIWVQGIEAAKSFLIAPNETVQLWDSENPIIYIKTADQSGMPSIKILDYTVRGEENKKAMNQFDNSQYATKEEFKKTQDSFESRLKDIEEKLKTLTNGGTHNESAL